MNGLMLGFKLVGGGLIIGAGYLAGITFIKSLKARAESLTLFSKGLEWFNSVIARDNSLLPEALESCGERIFQDKSNIFTSSAAKLKESSRSAEECWCCSCDEYYAQGDVLGEEDIKLLKEAGAYMGDPDVERQAKGIEHVENELLNMAQKAEEYLNKEGRLYQKLIFFAGIVLVLLLI